MSGPSLEEAAAIASEFISSLDNLPSEVQHLLQEIKAKETRSQELLIEIARDCNKYTRHALRQSPCSVPSTPISPAHSPTIPSTPGANGTSKSGNATPTTGAAPKDQALLPKIDAHYAEVDRLAAEKIALAERVVTLLTRTRARLDVELAKISVLQGDAVASDGVAGLGLGTGSSNPIAQLTENLKIALSPSAGGPDITMPTQKKRKLTSHLLSKMQSGAHSPLPTPTPPAIATPAATPYSRSRLSQQVHPRSNRRAAAMVQEDEEMDPDAEGEEDEEMDGDGEEAEDKGLYCFCQQMSHGEMVACDNPDCPYQWFHIGCVNLKAPLPDRYYCAECESKGFGVDTDASGSSVPPPSAPAGRKGRRK